jgi:hypothetical protein
MESEREWQTVGDGVELIGDDRERLQVFVVFIMNEKFEYKFPTLIR